MISDMTFQFCASQAIVTKLLVQSTESTRLLFLLGLICVPICVLSGLIYLAAAAVQGLLTCAERSLASFADGHVISGLLYLIPGGLLLCAFIQGLYLACSFYQAVVR